MRPNQVEFFNWFYQTLIVAPLFNFNFFIFFISRFILIHQNGCSYMPGDYNIIRLGAPINEKIPHMLMSKQFLKEDVIISAGLGYFELVTPIKTRRTGAPSSIKEGGVSNFEHAKSSHWCVPIVIIFFFNSLSLISIVPHLTLNCTIDVVHLKSFYCSAPTKIIFLPVIAFFLIWIASPFAPNKYWKFLLLRPHLDQIFLKQQFF